MLHCLLSARESKSRSGWEGRAGRAFQSARTQIEPTSSSRFEVCRVWISSDRIGATGRSSGIHRRLEDPRAGASALSERSSDVRKADRFERFARVCQLDGDRSTSIGEGLALREIVEIAIGMNPSGSGDTPRSDARESASGEGIVCASGNGGITRSSDLHEWRNDLGAVSTRDPVKL